MHNVIRDNEITCKKMKVNKIEFSVNEILELIIQSPMLLQRPYLQNM
jgi:arsenate reductase-like glutaredoxin family protein